MKTPVHAKLLLIALLSMALIPVCQATAIRDSLHSIQRIVIADEGAVVNETVANELAPEVDPEEYLDY